MSRTCSDISLANESSALLRLDLKRFSPNSSSYLGSYNTGQNVPLDTSLQIPVLCFYRSANFASTNHRILIGCKNMTLKKNTCEIKEYLNTKNLTIIKKTQAIYLLILPCGSNSNPRRRHLRSKLLALNYASSW